MSRRRRYLEYSRPFNPYRVSSDEKVLLLLDHLYEVIAAASVYRNRPNREVVIRNLQSLIFDLFIAYKTDPAYKVAIHKSPGWYSSSQYQNINIGFRPMMKIVSALVELRLIKEHIGYQNREVGVGRLTRLRARRPLIGLIESFDVKPSMIGFNRSEEVILLKDNNKHLIDYADTDLTQRMREELGLINDRLSQLSIDLYLNDAQFHELSHRIRADKSGSYFPVDFSRKKLRRIFNNCSFDAGGRLYHGWWQEIPSAYRKFIRINGTEVVEIDYTGMQIRMMYALKGIETPDDPYELGGIPKEYRKDIKKILNITINASSRVRARKAMESELPGRDIDILESAVLEKHEPISEYFYTGEGTRMQRMDGDIAVEVILRMDSEFHTVVLPVHDSFIVRNRFSDELEQVMKEVFLGKLGEEGLITIDENIRAERWEEGVNTIYTSEDVEDVISEIGSDYSILNRIESEWNP